MAVPKLDKKHGFLKLIVDNQIDRDNYDKEQKARKKGGEALGNKTKHREDRKMYVPPSVAKAIRDSKRDSKSTKEPSPENESYSDSRNEIKTQACQNEDHIKSSRVLFEVEYIPKNCAPVYAKVYQNSSPYSVAQEVARKCNMSDALIEALYHRISEEIEASR